MTPPSAAPRAGEDLSIEEVAEAFNLLIADAVTRSELDAGCWPSIAKGAERERSRRSGPGLTAEDDAHPLLAKSDLLDTCGTGGDRLHTFNISTAAASLPRRPAYRSPSTAIGRPERSGSADVLAVLG